MNVKTASVDLAEARTKKLLEWGGATTGVAGAWLLSLNTAVSGYGWLGYLVSNVFWIIFGLRIRAWGMVAMQVVYTGISLFGAYRWLLA